jgi:hypothetical protein
MAVLLFAYEAAQFIISDNVIGLAYVGMAFVAGVIVIAILNNWRTGVYFFLIWLLFEDYARKFLGNNMAIFFAKDFLLLVVFISFLRASGRRALTTFRPPFLVPLLIFIWFGILQVFNPASTSFWYGLLGVKMYFYYVPLVFVGYALVNSERELRRFFTLNIVLALIIISLGVAQSVLGPTFLNPAQPQEDIRELSTLYRVSPISGLAAYRPNSVFVSAGRYANFVMIAWLLVLGYSGYLLHREKKGRRLAFVALGLTAAGAFLTASRGSFMWAIINASATSVAFLWSTSWRQSQILRVFSAIRRLGVAVALVFVLLLTAYPDAVLSRLAIYKETLMPNSPTSELAFRSEQYPIQNFLNSFSYERWPYGYGIGTSGLGGQYVSRIFHVTPPVRGVESGFGTLVVEMGIGALILWLVLTAAILRSSWRVVKKLKGSPWFPLGFVIFWYAFAVFLPLTYGGIQAYEDFLMNAYLWLLLGLLFKLPGLALTAQSTANAQTSQVQPH